MSNSKDQNLGNSLIQVLGTLLILVIACGVCVTYNHTEPSTVVQPKLEDSVVVKLMNPPNFNQPLTDSLLVKTLQHYNFPEPAIIAAQGKLESGNYKSRIFIDYNNLFGLYNTKAKDYYRFDSWIDCVIAYRSYILNKYEPGEDYYDFLERIHYATDSLYIPKVKQCEKQLIIYL